MSHASALAYTSDYLIYIVIALIILAIIALVAIILISRKRKQQAAADRRDQFRFNQPGATRQESRQSGVTRQQARQSGATRQEPPMGKHGKHGR